MLLCVWQGMTADIFRKYMSVDKKVLDGALRLILLRGPLGSCTFTGDFDAQVLDQTLEAFCKPQQKESSEVILDIGDNTHQ